MQIKIDIQSPCSEKWESMSEQESNKFCHSCNHSVIDFTKMSDKEIFDFFTHSKGRVCGKLQADQKKVYLDYSKTENRDTRFKYLFGLLLSLSTQQLIAQNTAPKPNTLIQTTSQEAEIDIENSENFLKGRVVDHEGKPVVGANVQILNSYYGAVTDLDGIYTVKIGRYLLRKEDSLRIKVSFIGYQSLEAAIGPIHSQTRKGENYIRVDDAVLIEQENKVTLGIIICEKRRRFSLKRLYSRLFKRS